MCSSFICASAPPLHLLVHVRHADNDYALVVLHAGDPHSHVDRRPVLQLSENQLKDAAPVQGLRERPALHRPYERRPVLRIHIAICLLPASPEEILSPKQLGQRAAVCVRAVLYIFVGVRIDVIQIHIVPGQGHGDMGKDRTRAPLLFVGLLQPAPIFLLFVVHHEAVQQAGTQHIRNRIEGQIGEPELNKEESGHDDAEQRQRPVSLPLLRLAPQDRRERIRRDQQEEEDLAGQHHVTQRERVINAVAAHGEQNGDEYVHDRNNRDRPGNHAPGIDENAAKGVILLQIGNGILRPEQHAHRHGDEIDRGIREQQLIQLPIIQNAPQNIRDVIGEDRKQESSVHTPSGRQRSAIPTQQDVAV